VKHLTFCVTVLLIAAPAPALAQIPIGTRVGTPAGTSAAPDGYDPGGRRDPFVSLVQPKAGVPARPTGPAKSLITLSVADVKVTGISKGPSGQFHSAIIEGPNKLSFLVKPNDRLLDGVVRRIDALGVVFIEHQADASGAVQGREVRKLLHPPAEVIR
jgi:hypothetical protein